MAYNQGDDCWIIKPRFRSIAIVVPLGVRYTLMRHPAFSPHAHFRPLPHLLCLGVIFESFLHSLHSCLGWSAKVCSVLVHIVVTHALTTTACLVTVIPRELLPLSGGGGTSLDVELDGHRGVIVLDDLAGRSPPPSLLGLDQDQGKCASMPSRAPWRP